MSAQLADSAKSLSNLLKQFISTVSAEPVTPIAIPQNAPEPLEVLHTSAKLLKAHTTKLSLLVINKPFTPSAIRSVMAEVSATCVPAMMSAVEICQPKDFGSTMCAEVRMRVRRVLIELDSLMQEVLHKATEASGSSASATSGRDSLASTGVLWESCDDLMELKTLGIGGLLVQKAETYREMLEDATAELREWREDTEDEGFADDRGDDEEEADAQSDAGDSLERMLEVQNRLPHDREDLKQTLDAATKKLRLTSTLYAALAKRRLKTFSPGDRNPEHLKKLNDLMELLKGIPDSTDEMAGSFYDLDNDAAEKMLDKICRDASAAGKLMKDDWSGGEDKFSSWVQTCVDMLAKK